MKYSDAESQALLLVELLLNDPVVKWKCVTANEVDSILEKYNGEFVNDFDAAKNALLDVVELVYTKTEHVALHDLLTSLSKRSEVEILSVNQTDNEIMVNWCGMVGCILYRQDYNTWEMHT